MADNASIARPYAKAVFDLAQQSNAFDAWSVALKNLSLVSQDPAFSALLNDPKIDVDRLSNLLVELCQDSLPSEQGENFVKLLVRNNRLDALTNVEQQYNELVARHQQVAKAEVVTAMALTDQQKTDLTEALQKRLGMKVTLSETVDANLIGGAIIKAGDLVIDGSAKGRIEKLTTAMTH